MTTKIKIALSIGLTLGFFALAEMLIILNGIEIEVLGGLALGGGTSLLVVWVMDKAKR